jgi:DNA invertase Pin-like site-specific DNA recombinase
LPGAIANVRFDGIEGGAWDSQTAATWYSPLSLAAITGKGAGFRSLHDTWADATTAHGRLMLTVLDGLAKFKRELIRARTGEGRELAKAQGVRMGRKPKLTDHLKCEAIKRRDRDGETLRSIGRSYNVSAATISRLSP